MTHHTRDNLTNFVHGSDYQESNVSERFARIYLEQQRADASVARGRSNDRRMSPGHRFSLVDAGESGLDGDYAITGVRHRGRRPEHSREASTHLVYSNQLECVPSQTLCRPKQPPRRIMQVVESATVVGPDQAEGDIYTDELGRVRVHFYWDRDRPPDEYSSCWIRVMHSWAGQSWGTQFIPRVGMEVLVGFFGGDENRPVILGTAYNTTHPPPFALPSDRTKSGIRTRTVGEHGSLAGMNELSFEDSGGRERVYMHAERDFDIDVRRDAKWRVGHDALGARQGGTHTIEVADDQKTNIGRDQLLAVERDRTEHIKGESRETIEGNDTRVVGQTKSVTVAKDLVQHVDRNAQTTVGRHGKLEVQGNASSRVLGKVREHVGRSRKTVVDGSVSLSVGTSYALNATKGAMLEAGSALRLVCGTSSIVLRPDRIVLEADSIVLKSKHQRLEGPDVSLSLADGGVELEAKSEVKCTSDTSVRLESQAARLVMDGEGGSLTTYAKRAEHGGGKARLLLQDRAALEGDKVQLNPGEGSIDPESAQATPDELLTSWIALRLADQDGEPVAGARFHVTMSNDDIVTGVLSRKGTARVPIVPGPCKVTFPDYDGDSWL